MPFLPVDARAPSRTTWNVASNGSIITTRKSSAAPYTLEELGEAMHVRRADGEWAEGFWGALETLSVLPRWRWLARVLALWPFTRLGPVCYHWISRRRYTLFGIPPCDVIGLCTLHRPKS